MSILLELHIPNCVVIARMSIINLAHMIDTQGNIEVGRILWYMFEIEMHDSE